MHVRLTSISMWCRQWEMSLYHANSKLLPIQVAIIVFLTWWFFAPIKKWALARPTVFQKLLQKCCWDENDQNKQKNRSKRNQKLCLAFNCFILGVHGRYRIAYATYSKVGVFCALNSTCFMKFPSSEEFNGPGGRPKEKIGNTKGLGLNSWKPTTQSMDG